MKAPAQFTFIQGLPLGHSRRSYELEQSHARSHAAFVAHQRQKSKVKLRAGLRHHEVPEKHAIERLDKMVIPFRAMKQTANRSWTEDDCCGINVVSALRSTALAIQDSIDPSLQAAAVEHCFLIDPIEGRRTKQRVRKLNNSAALFASTASFQEPDHETPDPFKISINLEGFPGLRTDPFMCIPNSGDHRIGSTIDFYAQVLNPGNDTVCYIFNVTNVYASFLETIQDEYFFDAGLGLIQYLQEQLRAPGSQPSVHTLKHKGNAIAKVRDRLTRSDLSAGDVTIFAMIFLAALDRGMRNSVAHNLHKRNIAVMVAQRGGLKSLQDGSLLKTYLMHYDTFWTMQTGETIFPGQRRQYQPVYPTSPFSKELNALIGRLSPGFQTLVTEQVLSYDILPLLFRATHLARLGPRARDELLNQTRRSSKQYDDFWEACPCLCMPDTSCALLEKLLSLTLVCYSFMAFGSRSYPTALRGAQFEVTSKIAAYVPQSRTEEDCVIWMWIVIIDSWRMGRRLQPNGVALLFSLQARFPALRSVGAAVEVARRFIWTRDLDFSIREHWDDAMSPI
jgi:hypothetical protein